eukprot:scaffold6600_cov125-Isochrysis_galbana.AAC.1
MTTLATASWVQCAAVSTHCGRMRMPPQKWKPVADCSETSHWYLRGGSTATPPTMRWSEPRTAVGMAGGTATHTLQCTERTAANVRSKARIPAKDQRLL